MRLPDRVVLNVGQLGRFDFESGWYAYAGSALGPGGLAARLSRHRRASAIRHWHLDYLRPHALPIAAWYAMGDSRHECNWAEALLELPGASIPAPGFGASDCRCAAHLIGYLAPPSWPAFTRLVDVDVLKEVFNA